MKNKAYIVRNKKKLIFFIFKPIWGQRFTEVLPKLRVFSVWTWDGVELSCLLHQSRMCNVSQSYYLTKGVRNLAPKLTTRIIKIHDSLPGTLFICSHFQQQIILQSIAGLIIGLTVRALHTEKPPIFGRT